MIAVGLPILFSLIAGAPAHSQDLPEFDDRDFEVLEVLSNSKVLAKSNGSYFYCSAALSDDVSFVLVSDCAPFVGLAMAASAEARAAELESAAARAAEEAAAASRQAANALLRDSMANSEKLIDLIDGFPAEVVEGAVIVVAQKNGCQIAYGQGEVLSKGRARQMLNELGIDPGNVDEVGVQAVQKRFGETIGLLAERGVMEIDQEGIWAKLKDCH